MDILTDSFQRNIELPKGTDDVQFTDILDTEHTVPVLPALWREKPLFFIISQRVAAKSV